MVIKKRRMFFLAIALLCVLVIGSTLSTTMISVKAEAITQEDIVSIEECKIASTNWLFDNYNDGTVIKDIVPIMQDDTISSYCVNFEKDEAPNGYIVIDANKDSENFIPEFSFSGKGIYETLQKNAGIEEMASDEEKVIYSIGSFDYAIPIDENGNEFYASSDENLSQDTVKKMSKKVKEFKREKNNKNKRTPEAKQEYYDGFFTNSTIASTGGYSSKTITNAANFTPTLMSTFRAVNGYSGNCTPTAMANLLSYYDEQRGFSNLGSSRQNIYNRVVSLGSWDQYGSSGMAVSKAMSAAKSIVKDANYTYGSATYWFDLWSDWTRDLGNNYPVLTSVYGLKLDGTTWKEVGHAIVAIGYREYGDGAKYLRVYDGWNETADKYIWFNSDYFNSKNGYCVKVS